MAISKAKLMEEAQDSARRAEDFANRRRLAVGPKRRRSLAAAAAREMSRAAGCMRAARGFNDPLCQQYGVRLGALAAAAGRGLASVTWFIQVEGKEFAPPVIKRLRTRRQEANNKASYRKAMELARQGENFRWQNGRQQKMLLVELDGTAWSLEDLYGLVDAFCNSGVTRVQLAETQQDISRWREMSYEEWENYVR